MLLRSTRHTGSHTCRRLKFAPRNHDGTKDPLLSQHGPPPHNAKVAGEAIGLAVQLDLYDHRDDVW